MEKKNSQLVLILKLKVFVYKISQREPENHKAKKWDLNRFQKLNLKIYSANNLILITLGKKGTVRHSHIYDFPGPDIKRCIDSSRYFVLNAKETKSSPEVQEFIGICFSKKSESEIFTNVLEDYFLQCNSEKTEEHCNDRSNHHVQVIIKNEKLEKNSVESNQSNENHEHEHLFQCGICSDVCFTDMRMIKNHWRVVHGFLDAQHCSFCPQVFPSLELLSSHRLKIHGRPCGLCTDFIGETEEELKQHYNEDHQSILQFQCSFTDCEELCDSELILLEHIKSTHGPSYLSFCPKCQRAFIEEMDMMLHYHSHGRIRCGFCGHRQDSSFQLNVHLKQCHNGMKEPEVSVS